MVPAKEILPEMKGNLETVQTPPADTQGIRVRLQHVRRKAMAATTGDGLLRILTGCVAFLVLALVADWLLELPKNVRLIVLAVGGVGVLVLLFLWILRPLAKAPDMEGSALLVEKSDPRFNSRLISALQFEKANQAGNSFNQQMVSKTIAEAVHLSVASDFSSAVSFRPLLKYLWICLAACGLFIGWAVWKKNISQALLARFFLREVALPRKTRITFVSGNLTVGLGDPVMILARVEGVIPEIGMLITETADGKRQEFPLDRKESSNEFERRLESVSQSLNYSVRLNDSRSERFKITVQERPLVTGIKGRIEFPPYTRLGTTNISMVDLNPLIGSKLYFDFTSNKELVSGHAVLAGTGQTVPIQISTSNRKEGRVVIPVGQTNLSGFSLELADTQQMTSTNSPVYAIRVRPDGIPQVSIRYPDRKEELLTQTARLSVLYEMHDDFGLSDGMFNYRVHSPGGTRGKANSIPLASAKGVLNITNRHEFALSNALNLKEGMQLEYWISARDNNIISGPGKGESEVYVVKIVSSEEKRRDLMHRVSDSLGGLNELATEQEKLNENLGTVLRPK